MTWRRLVFWIVFVVTYVPLFLMFVCGYLAEGLMGKMQALEAWSER